MHSKQPRLIELIRGEPSYPEGLTTLRAPPIRLRCLGAAIASAPSVAIVGTRSADPEALEFAMRLAAELARAGQVIVSGGALGVDAAAHEGALSAGGQTIAVLPAGFAPAYPRTHEGLFARIVANGGALLSEMDDATPMAKFRLLRRNELIAGLANVVVVVQAPLVSGALSTARVARRLGREVFSVPASPWDLRGEGCNALLRSGARICVGAQDVLSVCPPGRPQAGTSGDPPHLASVLQNDLDDDEQRVLGAVGARPRHVDEIVRSVELPTDRVQRALMVLLLSGRVDERDGGRYVRAPQMR